MPQEVLFDQNFKPPFPRNISYYLFFFPVIIYTTIQ